MVATPETRVTAADVLVSLTASAAAARVTMADVLVTLRASSGETRVTEGVVLTAGRTANPKLRAWTFSLDGHDYYVLRLGDSLTLVYDVYSEQWMDWDAFGEIFWPVNIGFNWVGGQGVTDAAGDTFGSNVLVGDDTYPLALWFLDPTSLTMKAPGIA
jgi:hypothetical protein